MIQEDIQRKKEGDTLKKLYVPSPEQKESARHGETLFPMQKYITKLDLVYPVVTTHWHEEAELTLITEGEGLYQIDLVDYEVKKGDILFVPPLLLHSVSLAQPQNEEMISETYVFHLNFLGGNSTDICSTRYFVPIMNHELILPCLITPKHPAYVSIRKIFRQIAALYHEEVPGYELALKGLFLQVIFLLLQYSTKQAKNVLPEEGTPAAEMEDQIDEEVKEDRQADIMELQQEIAFDKAEDMIGREVLVMIEGKVADENAYVGRTYRDAPNVDGLIFINTDVELISGDFAKVKVTGALDYDLIGELM